MSTGGGALGSGHNLTVDREFRYIVQWFTEWSDFQREDFVPVLASYLAGANPGGPVYVNGIISGMANVSGEDKPMSLFQCRVKLFNEWSAKWPESNREKLLERLTEIDPVFAEQVQRELTGGGSNSHHDDPTSWYDEEPTEDEEHSSMTPSVTTIITSPPAEQQTPIVLAIGED